MNWQYFVLGLIAWQLVKALSLAINRAVIEHRQKQFIKLVRVLFPDNTEIKFIALDSSDKRSMARLERQLREEYNLEKEEAEEGSRPRS